MALPLDVPTLADARAWVDRLAPDVGLFKVGLQLFLSEGPAAVHAVHDAGAACFLDLKLHDIPATMAKEAGSAARLGVRYLTVHAAAGPEALKAVAAALEGSGTQALAVTVLTSMDEGALDAVGLAGPASDAVERLARVAWASGVRGFVCSPLEVAGLRAALGPDATLVVPGVRPVGSAVGDQRRVATPEAAVAAGADVLVVGRPIRHAPDPGEAARAILRVFA
ncbi:MAG: orotidine-5'-phosphate decarboxylase [Myxococcota bacterium]